MEGVVDDAKDEAELLLSRIEGLEGNAEAPHPLTHALREHAELIDRDAPPKAFLQVHEMNVDSALDRMIEYWKARTKMLGEGLAFSPSRELLDFNSLKSTPKQSMLLPFDKFSRSVLYVSASALNRDLDDKELFCLSQLISENPISQVDGFVVVHNVENGSLETDIAVAKFLSNAVASKLKRYFLVCPKTTPALTNSKIPEITRILGVAPLPIKPVVIIGSSASAVQCQLEQEGLKSECLPTEVGGSFCPEDFLVWLKKYADAPCVPVSRWAAVVSLVKNTVSNYIGEKQPSTPSPDPPVDRSEPDPSGGDVDAGMTQDALQNNPKAALVQIEEAMEFVCQQDRDAFLEAKQRAPHLILSESNPLWYLQLEDYNVWAAARRIGCYWRFRKFAFEDRAFLPLALHNEVESAMSPVDRQLFETGFMTLGPSDEKGRTVIMFNRARLVGTSYEEDEYDKNRCSIFMFVLQLASELDASRDNGLVFVSDFGTHKNRGSLNDETAKQCVKALQLGAFPVQVRQSHLIVRPGKNIISRVLLNAVYPIVDGWNYLMKLTFLHIQSDRLKLLSILEKHGFKKEGLYHALGGTWSYKKDFKLWLDYRVYCESIKFGIADDQDTSKGGMLSHDDFRKAQKRKMDVLYARRKRQRYKIEVDVLDSRAEEYKRENASLKVKNAHLEGLLMDARLLESRVAQASSLGAANFTGGSSQNEGTMFSRQFRYS